MELKVSVPSSQQPPTGLYSAQHEFRLHLSVLLGTHFNNILLPLFHTFKWPHTSCFLTKKCVRLSSVPFMPRAPPVWTTSLHRPSKIWWGQNIKLFFTFILQPPGTYFLLHLSR